MAPAKKKGGKKHQKKPPPPPRTATTNTPAAAASAIANWKLPSEIILSILLHLPIRTLLRFQCLCKPLYAALTHPKFISTHRDANANDPLRHAFIVEATEMDGESLPTLSLLYAYDSAEKSRREQFVALSYPFPILSNPLEIVGSVNGIVCLSSYPYGRTIILWNPATNQGKTVRLSAFQLNEDCERVSIGLGYDSVKDDYKIVRIVCFKPKGFNSPKELIRARAEIYSSKLDSWKRQNYQADFPHKVCSTKNNAIVKGMPFWVGITSESKSEFKIAEVLLWYDTENDVFRHVPMLMSADSENYYGNGALIVEWKGHLGSLVHFTNYNVMKDFVDVFVYDFSEKRWKFKSALGPLETPMNCVLQCSKDGVILGQNLEGDLLLYDPESNAIEKFYIDEDEELLFCYIAVSFTASLVKVKGMTPLVKQWDEIVAYN